MKIRNLLIAILANMTVNSTQNFVGKTIVPFITHVSKAEPDVQRWLRELGLIKQPVKSIAHVKEN